MANRRKALKSPDFQCFLFLAKFQGSNRSGDIEKVMENAVYLHLKNLGYKIRIGTLPAGEIDFVAEKGGKTVYMQVSYLLADENTIARECENLLKIPDNYPKYVVSMDPIIKPQDYDGITQMSLRQCLMCEEF